MAKDFKAALKKRKGSLKNKNEKHKMQHRTQEAIISAEENPTKENIATVIKAVKEDKILTSEQKKDMLSSFEKKYLNLFEKCPIDYSNLKLEAKFLANMTSHSFILLAERLKVIRDQKLYMEDGYKDFKTFLKNEINVSFQTTYKYLNMIDIFGVAALRLLKSPTNTIPFLPIINSLENDNQKDKLKEKALEIASTNSFRKSEDIAKKLKVDFGLRKVSNPDQKIIKIKNSIDKLNFEELEIIMKYGMNKLKLFEKK